MRRWFCVLLCLVMILTCLPSSFAKATEVPSAPLRRAANARSGMVRVYLSSMGTVSQLDVTVQGSYTTSGKKKLTLSTGDRVSVAFNKSTGKMTMTHNGKSYDMGKEMAFRRHAASGASGLNIAQSRMPGNLYPGDLHLKAQQVSGTWKLYPIVHVYMEYYLNGVVPYEMGNSSGMEALKAQAVAARTYTLNKMNTRASALYDVVDTTNDQVYYGNSDSTANCTAAVEATKGIVLMNGDQLTSTYYTASNGGQTESAKNKWNTAGLAYLEVKDDPFDLMNTSATVRKLTVYADNSYSAQDVDLKSLLNNKAAQAFRDKGWNASGARVTRIRDITPHTPMFASPSRLYTKLDFDVDARCDGGSSSFTLTFDIFSDLESKLGMSINSVKNELWTVVRVGENFRLESRRFGHGVGMSQRGAMQMASMGYTYDQILGFYYKDCVRVQYTFTHTILSDVQSGGDDTLTSTEDPAEITGGSGHQATVKLVGVKDSLAVRGTADNNGPILTSVMNGSMVTVLARRSDWTLIALGKIVGYVPTSALVFTSTPPTTSNQTPTVIDQWAVVNCSGKLNLRQSASLSAAVIGSIPDGSVLCVFNVKNGWANVQYGAMAGWASMDFLKLSDSYPGPVTGSLTSTATVNLSDGAGTVNLRETPSTTARVLTTIPHGRQVTLITNDGSWCHVDYKGTEGYIMTRYLALGSTQDDEEDDEPSAPEMNDGEVEAVVTTVSGTLNLREEPSTAARVLAAIPRGESIIVTQRGSEWCAVRYAGLRGYVMTQYLTFPGDAAGGTVTGYATVNTVSGALNMRSEPTTGSSIVATIPKGARVGLISPSGKWYRVRYEGKTGYVMTEYLLMENASDSSSTGAYAVVNTPSGGLNLRETPSADARVLLTIPQGTALKVLKHQNGWCKVTYAGQTGYVMDRYLQFTDDQPGQDWNEDDLSSSSVSVSTGGGGLNLRETPSADARVLLSIPNGATVTLLDTGESWCKVKYNGSTGYVMSKYLNLSVNNLMEEVTTARAWVKTSGSSLNLRETPSDTANVVGSIPNGAEVAMITYGAPWTEVRYQGHTGYVMTQYLTLVEPESKQQSQEGDVVWEAVISPAEGNLNMRQEPDTSALVLTAIPKGEVVQLLAWGDEWCKIRYKEWEGYCVTMYLTLQRAD